MLCFSTQIIVGTLCVKDHQFLRLEHRLGLMEILKKPKNKYFGLKKIIIYLFFVEEIDIRGHLISRI